MKKVSIIVPVYNTEKYMAKCLNSLVHQTLKDIEIIIVDNGSTDKSYDIAHSFAYQDKRIKLLQQKNTGFSKARNEGLKIAQGEYIAFIDSDDYIDTDFFEKLYNTAEKYCCDIACATILSKGAKSQKYRVYYNEEKVFSTLEDKIKVSDIPNCCCIWNKIYKKDLITNMYFKEGVLFEDILWIPEVLKKSNKLVTVPNTQYYYVVRQDSIVKKLPNKQKLIDTYNSKKYIIKFFDENKLTLDHKYRSVTKDTKFFFNIRILKIKEYRNTETALLFDLIPIYKIISKGNSRFVLKILFLKFTFRNKLLSEKKILELNLPYEKGNGIIPSVCNNEETLNELINSNRSICRFGDGEFNLIAGEDLNFQKFDNNLKQRLSEILTCDKDDIMVGIPNIFGTLDHHKAKSFWRKYLVYNREDIYSLLNMNKQYYDSCITRVYIDTYKTQEEYKTIFDKFKSLWNNRAVVIIEGEGSRFGVGNNLFDCAKSIKRILCPAINAYSKYDDILASCKSFPKNTLFILALGPTATVLAYDLNNLGYRALDLGHLDIEYEWFLQGATKKVAIKNKYTNEVKTGRKLTPINDSKYNNQIYTKIK